MIYKLIINTLNSTFQFFLSQNIVFISEMNYLQLQFLDHLFSNPPMDFNTGTEGGRRRGGVFSVKSCYTILQRLDVAVGGFTTAKDVVFRDIWKSRAPSKALAFSRKLILDRIPTKVNLAKRRLLAIEDSKRCIFCGIYDETSVHLFLHCHVISQVWRER